jgi:hypothetical protein
LHNLHRTVAGGIPSPLKNFAKDNVDNIHVRICALIAFVSARAHESIAFLLSSWFGANRHAVLIKGAFGKVGTAARLVTRR